MPLHDPTRLHWVALAMPVLVLQSQNAFQRLTATRGLLRPRHAGVVVASRSAACYLLDQDGGDSVVKRGPNHCFQYCLA